MNFVVDALNLKICIEDNDLCVPHIDEISNVRNFPVYIQNTNTPYCGNNVIKFIRGNDFGFNFILALFFMALKLS